MKWVPLGKEQAMKASITKWSTKVWVHDIEIRVVKMEIVLLDSEKGVQGARQWGQYSGKIFKGVVWVWIIERYRNKQQHLMPLSPS